MRKDYTNGYVCKKEVTINVDAETLQFKVGDLAPSHIVAGFPRAIRETHFDRNPALRGNVKAT